MIIPGKREATKLYQVTIKMDLIVRADSVMEAAQAERKWFHDQPALNIHEETPQLIGFVHQVVDDLITNLITKSMPEPEPK